MHTDAAIKALTCSKKKKKTKKQKNKRKSKIRDTLDLENTSSKVSAIARELDMDFHNTIFLNGNGNNYKKWV